MAPVVPTCTRVGEPEEEQEEFVVVSKKKLEQLLLGLLDRVPHSSTSSQVHSICFKQVSNSC